MGDHEEETNTSPGGNNEEKIMAKNRAYTLPAFSLDKRIKGLKAGAIKKVKSTGKVELNNSVLQEVQNLFIY
jgi:hypothetical protein